MTEHVKVYAMLTAKKGRVDDLTSLLRGMVQPSRLEAGNLRYDLWRDRETAGRFVLDEIYVDQAAATAHRETPHFQHYLSKVNDFAERLAVSVLPVDVVPGGENVQ
ncbi:antibiotic biosynthesis monooxygenase [Rhizobium leguminosarum]|uniref:putative quinol monooxygenase n=1 Tax=Rhizobium leguminosarum TaxID=384 RepID=UPI001C98DB0D|nr:putative quinol monooxygenase [Rhizobium leguminosarum]MBY5538238.1 antibiotic biosynthesis monooxygenase [Rhizobium leguminosarum]